ncbi:YbjN domain-containing protein [Azorhizobium doebereinerae]|uniref:YbjN domain-containing protein n=1 Tax=Azorhizobium doebereinerae TaxID=281091 RepID=UPI00040A728B|nr:YbjN domain-containing protein [Azorhizobium doebereinerae]
MSLIEIETESSANPVDLVEQLAALRDWSFERSAEDEITLSLNNRWTDCHVSFQWMDEIEALHLACAFDVKVPDNRRGEVLKLLALVNEQMWLGHFDIWPQEGVIMFRHALVLAGGATASDRQCEAILDAAMDAVDRYYPAFQFVVWAGKTAREAMDSALFETAGEA